MSEILFDNQDNTVTSADYLLHTSDFMSSTNSDVLPEYSVSDHDLEKERSVLNRDIDREKNVQIGNENDMSEISDQMNSLSLKTDNHPFKVLDDESASNSSISSDIDLYKNKHPLLEQKPPLPSPPIQCDSSSNIVDSNSGDRYSLPSLSKDRQKNNINESNSKPMIIDIDNIDPVKYGLPKEYDKQAIAEYIMRESEKVLCGECKKLHYKLESFYDNILEKYICIKCSTKKDNVKNLSWEDEEVKSPIEGYRRCKRLAHYKPLWSFISRDKQTGKDKKKLPINDNALKDEKQCIFCRNIKKWEYARNRRRR